MKIALAVGVVFCATVCMGDSITIGANRYDNVYVVESSSRYIVCLPVDGRIVSVLKADVSPGALCITQDRDTRSALFNEWLDRRMESKKRVFFTPIIGFRDEPGNDAKAGSAVRATSEKKEEATRKSTATAPPVPPNDGKKRFPLVSQQEDAKLLQQEAIERMREQARAAKQREQDRFSALTTQSIRNGNAIQWGNPVLWNSPVRWGSSVQWYGGGYTGNY